MKPLEKKDVYPMLLEEEKLWCDMIKATRLKEVVAGLKEEVEVAWKLAGILENESDKTIKQTIELMNDLIDEAFGKALEDEK